MATVGYPKGGKPVSQATISKLKSAMGDPTKTIYGKTLRQASRAPDGGAPADYSKGWRFLPENVLMPAGSKTFDGREAEGLWSDTIMKNEARFPQKVAESKTGTVIYGNTGQGMQIVQAMKDLHNSNGNNPKAQKIIDDHYYNLVIAPQIKAQEEAIARKEEEERLAIATLKMRVIELEKQQTPKRPTPTPTAPAITTSPTSYLPLAVVGIVIVVILLFLRRRA